MKNDINRPPMAVILAAGIGSRLRPLTDNCPKSLLSVGGSVILERIIRNCLSCSISQFVIVLGHRADQIRQFVDKTFRGIRVTYVINDKYRETNTGYSLMLAAAAVGGSEFIKFDADVVFDPEVLRRLLDDDWPDMLCINRKIGLADKDVKVIVDDDLGVLEIGTSVDPAVAVGDSIGIEKISAETGPRLFAELKKMMESPGHYQDLHAVAYARLIKSDVVFRALDITGLNWTAIDIAEDFAAANAMFGSPITTVSRGQQRVLDVADDQPPIPR